MESAIDFRPNLNIELCKKLIEKLYGIKTILEIKELNGYDDKNYKILLPETSEEVSYHFPVCSDGYVFKVMNSLESKDIGFIETQNKILIHLAKNDVKCPIPIRNINDLYYSLEEISGKQHICRLFEFQSGTVFFQVETTNRLLTQAGEFIANINNLLTGFQDDILKSRKLIWMLTAVPEVSKYLDCIKSSSKRQMVEDIIESFKTNVLTRLEELEQGVIHGDFNEQNIIVQQDNSGEWNISAVIDFGDMHYSCYLFELAITMTYAMLLTKSIPAGGHVIAGYQKKRPITQQEKELLKICIAARLVQSLVLGLYAHSQDPTNTYVLTTQENGWAMLQEIWEIPNSKLLQMWENV